MGGRSQPTLRKQVWETIDHFDKIKLEKGEAKTIEQARELVFDEHPSLYHGYQLGVSRGEPAEFASVPVEKNEPETPAWDRMTELAKVKLEKGLAPTIEQAIVQVGTEHPEIWMQAEEEG